MWFLKGRPTNIKVRALITSISGGYQQNNFRFSIQADPESTHDGKIWIALAVPWAPHKPNGSVSFHNDNLLSLIEENSSNKETVTVLEESDVKVWTRLRDLKTEPNIDLIHVQDLINWYIDDMGIITAWVEPGVVYQLNYGHKIAADSKLFLPTRLPTVIGGSATCPSMDYELWVVNGVLIDLPIHMQREIYDPSLRNLLKESQTSLGKLSYKKWAWDDDTRISTENWESSDDELSSDE